METILSTQFNGKTLHFKVTNGLYLEEPTWIIRTSEGKDLILVRKNGGWQQLNENNREKRLVKAMGEAIDRAQNQGKKPFAIVENIPPPPSELF